MTTWRVQPLLLVFALVAASDVGATVRDDVLRGAGGTLRIPLKAGAGRVTLRVRYAEPLDADRSTLQLSANGRPLRSLRLAQLDAPPSASEVVVDVAEARTLQVAARLWLVDPACAPPDPALSWIRIETAAASARLPTRQGHRPAAGPLAARVDAHRAAWAGADVVLSSSTSEEASAHVATVVMAQSILRQGGRPVAGPSSAAAEAAFRVALSTTSSPGGEAMQALLEEAPNVTSAVVLPGPWQLAIHGRDADALLDATHQLASGALDRLCPHGGPCFLTKTVARGRTDELERPGDRAGVVWSLTDEVGPAGWTADGVGEHALRFEVQRPDTFRIDRAPVLTLHAYAPRGERLEHRWSGLEVRVNGRPLSSWSLERLQEGSRTLQVRLPKTLWRASRWRFELVADLQLAGEEACDRTLAPRLYLGPESTLVVARSEKRFAGLSGFFDQARNARPALRFAAAPSLPSLIAFAQQTAAFANLTPTARWTTATDHDRLQLVLAERPATISLAPRGPRAWWAGENHAAPVLVDRGTPLMSWSAAEGVETVAVVPGAARCPTAPWWALHGTAAACLQEQWEVLDAEPPQVAAVSVVDAEVSGDAEVATVGQTQIAVVNIIWGVLLLACAVATVLYWRPRRQRRRPVGMSIEHGLGGSS
jgi:hypothetical protein